MHSKPLCSYSEKETKSLNLIGPDPAVKRGDRSVGVCSLHT